ncbi:MAG: hypothetical protein ABH820_01925 [Patescibacteria group bacterium]|nr:hypothetical protein [Patescibacteria group bacterium]MBU2509035.1 hypothetical protein [Patescibacteria group bacterium]
MGTWTFYIAAFICGIFGIISILGILGFTFSDPPDILGSIRAFWKKRSRISELLKRIRISIRQRWYKFRDAEEEKRILSEMEELRLKFHQSKPDQPVVRTNLRAKYELRALQLLYTVPPIDVPPPEMQADLEATTGEDQDVPAVSKNSSEL